MEDINNKWINVSRLSTSNSNVTTPLGLISKEPLHSQASPLEILILDGSPKPIRKKLTTLSHKDKDLKQLLFSPDSNSKMELPTANQHTSERFKPPVVRQKTFPAQPRVYEEIETQNDNDISYDSDDYENMPKKPEGTTSSVHSWKSVKKSSSSTEKPPIPPPRRKYLGSVKSSSDMFTHSSTNTAKRKLSTPSNFCTNDNKSSLLVKESFLSSMPRGNTSTPQMTTTSPHNNNSSVLSSNSVDSHSSREENLAYLKMLSLNNMLQLLDNMNLGQYKERFMEERIDGEILIHLDRGDLVELGITKTIHQTRLLKLVDGSISARKFQHS